MHNFRIRALHTYVVVVDCGSMSKAAERIGVSQSAVSQTITELESNCGVTLLDRSGKSLSCTLQGRIFYEHAQEIVSIFDRALREMHGSHRAKYSRISIAMADSLALALSGDIVELLSSVTERVVFSAGITPTHIDQFLSREQDIIVTVDAIIPGDEGLVRSTILEEPYVLAVPATYRGDADDIAEIVDELNFVHYGMLSRTGQQVEEILRYLNAPIKIRFEVESLITQLSMIAKNRGFGIVTPLCYSRAYANLDQIKLVPLKGANFTRRATLIARKNEFGTLPERLTEMSRSVLRTRYLPPIIDRFPWLQNAFKYV